MSTIDIARGSITRHEGYRQFVYTDTVGKATVGIGRNLVDKGISRLEADFLLDNDIADCIQDLSGFAYWNSLSDRQQAALIDLRFCLGPTGYRKFRNMDRELHAGNFKQAGAEILNSVFARQTGHRAQDIITMLEDI